MEKDNNMCCVKCDTKLSVKEIDFYLHQQKFTDEWFINLCEKHWCKCMPETTPWRYLTQCANCSANICKSCKYNTETGEIVCENCFNIISNISKYIN
jgi:hypothetical protein